MVMCWRDWWWQHGLSAPLGGMCHQPFMSMWSPNSHGMVLLWWLDATFAGDLLQIQWKTLGLPSLGF